MSEDPDKNDRIPGKENECKDNTGNLPGTSNPFASFESAVSEEQLATWQAMNKKVKSLVQMSDDEEEEDDEDGNPDDDTLAMIDHTLLVTSKPLSIDLPSETGDGRKQTSSTRKVLSSQEIASKCPANMELTLLYLTGKITFMELSEMMEKNEEEDSTQDKSGVSTSTAAEPQPGMDDESEVSQTAKDTGKKKMRKQRRKRFDLPKHLENSMGEVSMLFATGNQDEAIKLCLEIIRQAPKASKPFQTLGMIYEDMGDASKSLQFYLIAAYLNPNDSEEWARLADMCLEQNEINQALKCYTQAIRHGGPKRVDYIWERARLFESQKDFKKAMEGYQSILPLLPKEDSEKYFKLAWALTRSYYELGDKERALETITAAFKDHPEQITSEDVNLLLELQIPEKKYAESLDVFVQHCGVVFETTSLKSDAQTQLYSDLKDKDITSCSVPEMLPIDLRIKLCTCLIHLKHIRLVQSTLEPLYEEDIEETGDLYLDVAEAYMENGYHKQAKPILRMLVHTKNYHLAAVWLRYGECLKYVGDVRGAVKAYTWVVKLAPTHLGARMSLSALQQQLGKHEEALEVLQSDEIEERRLTREEQQMLLQKCHLLHAQGKLDEFFINAKNLLFQEWRDVEAENMTHLEAIRTYKHRKETLLNHFESKGKDTMRLGSHLKIDRNFTYVISYNDMWEMFKELCVALIENGRMVEFEEASLLGMLCPLFGEEEHIEDFEFFILSASLVSKNSRRAYTFGRHFVLQNSQSVQAWNLFMQVIMMCNDTRHNRFCLRRMLHEPNNIALGIMNGHNSMTSGSYKHSLGEYANVFRRQPTDPMLSLCIGLDFIHCASQRFAAKRHYLVTQGMAFLNNYITLRGECQETFYNLGRALHQINILYAAVHYYEKALTLEPCIGEKGGMFDLTKEIAFNMSLIYTHSGSHEYARFLLLKYCII